MKLQVAYDSQGRILTVVPRAITKSGPTVSVEPRDGAEIGEFDVPKEFEGNQLNEFVHLLRVDTKGKRLIAGTKG